MPVTDLTGTTWVFNDTFPPHFPEKGEYYTEGDVRGLTPTSDYGYFIDFIWKDEYGEYNCNYIYNYNYDAGTTIGVATYPNGPQHYFNGSMTITGGTDVTNTNLINWFEAHATQQIVSPKVSVDLATLTGWASLSDGTHNITIVAKADGYRDSEPSAAVSVTKGAEEYTDCITFTGESSDFTLKATNKEWDGTVEYSTDHNTWTTWNGSEISSSGKKLYLRGSGNTTFHEVNGARLSLSAKAACSGNLNTLLEYSNPPTTLADSCYSSMFQGCTSLTQAPELPATTLANSCYNYMFEGCTNLTTAPTLNATTLANHCYAFMFNGCTNLTTAPALPATTLAKECYYYMFRGCTSLTQAPELPATTLADFCYSNMFNGCTSLTQAPTLPATTLAPFCCSSMFEGCINLTIAPELPAISLVYGCYTSMFRDCTNLTAAPALPAMILQDFCYENMFRGCTNLTVVPALPAISLGEMCYSYMFYGCTKLKVSTYETGTYRYAWRIPTIGQIPTILSYWRDWNHGMLGNTGGTFTSNPSQNSTYYIENEPVISTVGSEMTYSISVMATNCTASATNPTTIHGNEVILMHFIANEDYYIPDTVTVSGGASSWNISSDKREGKLTLGNATSDILITINGDYIERYTVTIDHTGYQTAEIAGNFLFNFADGTSKYISVDSDADTIINNVVSIKCLASQDAYISYRLTDGTSREAQLGYGSVLMIPDDIVIYHVIMVTNCLWEGTLVTMADGSLKALGDIEVGDEVLSIDYDTMTLVGRKVIYSGRDEPDYDHWETPIYYENVFSDGTVIRQSMHHRFYNLEQQRYVYLHEWNIGEHTYSINGENPTLISRKLIQAPQRYARITLEGSNNWFANGLSTGDRHCPTDIILTDLLQ